MPIVIAANELESLFDALPDVVFFVKDTAGRYTHANLTLVRRLGLKRRAQVIGHGVAELFPAHMGGSYAAQDRRVLAGETVEDQLEVHIFPNRAPGWCLTRKHPLRVRGKVRGVIWKTLRKCRSSWASDTPANSANFAMRTLSA